MITFNEFLEHKRVESTMTECAHLMVELDVNPYEYIYESLKEIDPVLAEGWWDGVKAAAGNVWQGVKRFVGDTAAGVKAGARQAADAVAGPVAKFDAVERALTDLVGLLKKDQRFQNFQSSTGKGSVGQYLGAVLNALQKDKQALPQLMQTQVNQNYGTRAQADAENKGQPAQAAKPAMDMSKLGGAEAPPAAATTPAARSWERRSAGRM
jgi:hypothetical protein